jgi:hypothetical protein
MGITHQWHFTSTRALTFNSHATIYETLTVRLSRYESCTLMTVFVLSAKMCKVHVLTRGHSVLWLKERSLIQSGQKEVPWTDHAPCLCDVHELLCPLYICMFLCSHWTIMFAFVMVVMKL